MGPFGGYWPGFWSFWANFGGSEPGSGPIFLILGLNFDLFLGSGPGYGSLWANFRRYGPGFWLDLGLFWVLGVDSVHIGPISGVMGLDLGLFLGSGPGLGRFRSISGF